MVDTVASNRVRRPDGPITLEEWNKIMSRIYRILDHELSAIEIKQNKAKRDSYQELTDRDTRRILTIVSAVGRVQDVNSKVRLDNASEQEIRDFKANENYKDALLRRIDKIMDGEEA
jgi:hypothetical protein